MLYTPVGNGKISLSDESARLAGTLPATSSRMATTSDAAVGVLNVAMTLAFVAAGGKDRMHKPWLLLVSRRAQRRWRVHLTAELRDLAENTASGLL